MWEVSGSEFSFCVDVVMIVGVNSRQGKVNCIRGTTSRQGRVSGLNSESDIARMFVVYSGEAVVGRERCLGWFGG